MFSKRKNKSMVQLEEMVFNLGRAAIEFGKMDFSIHLDLKAYSDNIKTYEPYDDELVHQVITGLNQTFVTPIKREDILSLCDAVGDVLDVIEETAAMFEMYSIEYTDEYMAEFADNIQEAVTGMRLAVSLLVNKGLSHMCIHSINVKEFETNCDGTLRQSIKHISSNETDPITLIKIKGIYESMKEAADKRQIVANSFETIIMKNN